MENEINILQQNFLKRGYRFSYFENTNDAISYIMNLIPEQASIGFGGSQTVLESGLLSALDASGKYTLLHRDICKEYSIDELFQKMHQADWYIASANALCQTGDIINIDGRANRVSSILNGPKNVLLICGTNKIVSTVEEGIDRARNVAATANCKRLQKKTPCYYTGQCVRCNSPETICNATVIQHHPTSGSTVYVVLIHKNLGY